MTKKARHRGRETVSIHREKKLEVSGKKLKKRVKGTDQNGPYPQKLGKKGGPQNKLPPPNEDQ